MAVLSGPADELTWPPRPAERCTEDRLVSTVNKAELLVETTETEVGAVRGAEAAVAAAAAAAALAALSAGCGGRNFRIISLGSFSRGSWCHLVGTGGGTVIERLGGFSSNSVKLGFSEQTTLETLLTGALSRGELAGLFTPYLRSLFNNFMILEDGFEAGEVLESVESPEEPEVLGWKLEFRSCLSS